MPAEISHIYTLSSKCEQKLGEKVEKEGVGNGYVCYTLVTAMFYH